MAGRIAGITIEIGGDSTKLQNSLKGVDKSLKQTQTALKDIDKLLKFNPGNTELLVQKQRNLKKAIGETKDRLKELRKAAENTTPEEIGQEKYDALQREIIDTENKLKSLTKEMHSFGSVAGQKLQAVGASMKELGGKIQNVGKELSTKVTAPILALGTASIMAFKEVDDAFDIVISKTGATGDALKEMQDQVTGIAETMPVSFEDAGTAIGEVNTRFGVTGEQLDEISRQFLKFAKINGTDVNTSIDTIQSAMAAFGMTADDTTAVLDAFNAAGQATGVPLDRLAESVKKNSATLQEMDLSLNDSITFLAQLDKSGMDSSTVMTGLRKALAKAAKEGKPMNQALQELQDSLTGATDETTASQMAIELFGTKAGAAIAQYVRNGQLDFSTLAQSAQDSAGSVSSTYDEIVDPLDEFTMALNQLKVIGMEIGSAVMPFISQALGILRDVLEKLKAAWESLSPAQQEMIVKIALIVAAIGPLLTVLGGVISAAGTIISVLGMLLSPIGLVIAAIAGLIAAGLWLHSHWDQVCEWANNLKERVTQAFEGLKANVTAKIQAAKDKVSSVVNAMKADVSGKVNALKSAVSNAFSAVHNAISSKMSAAKNAVSNAISAIKGLLSGSISFPHITLPHFTVTGSPPFGLGGHGSPPHISVEWYAKAMKQPYVLDGATIFGMMGGKMLGGGEAGKEAILSLDRLKEYAGSTVVEVNMTINGAKGQDVNVLADRVAERIYQQVRRAGA
ncbi:MAG: phage tail tape measure protein [Aeriscardovia sp.]|nr:phage tail tape measure protein [Aeriscardovia sp.]